MIIGTVAWAWKGYIELALIICAWGIWIECMSGTVTIMNRLTPPTEAVKKLKELVEKLKNP